MISKSTKMSNSRQSTEFSTHLSRSRMRRYLHGQLSAQESHQVEVHLANCTHCSAALVNYIEVEEADQYNTYVSKLSGKLKEQKITKRSTLSSFQIKAIRTVAAVVTLVIFSFFGVKNIINKEVDNYQSKETSLPVRSQSAVTATKPVDKKVATQPSENKEDHRLAENHSAKKNSQQTTTNRASAPTEKKVVTKKAAPAVKKSIVKPKVKKQTTPVAKEPEVTTLEKEKTETKVTPIQKTDVVEKVAESTIDQSETDSESATQLEVKPMKILPAVKKMDAAKQIDSSKPVGITTPSVVPVPGGGLK